MQGRIFQINASAGGVPKSALRQAQVAKLGLEGDNHNNKEVHGGPERALCLFSLEQIQALQAEGHPIFPGSIGENLTLTGLDWREIVPGMRLALGKQVQIEITKFTSPCQKIMESFQNGDFNRVSEKLHPGWSRVYARVLQGGEIQLGDVVTTI